MSEIAEIKRRHEARDKTTIMSKAHGEAVSDRATLLRALDEAQARAERAEAALTELRVVAEPWLLWANELDDDRPDDNVVSSLIEAGHYRRLAAQLKERNDV